jgi:amidase
MARSARDLRLLLSILEDAPLPARQAPPALKSLKFGVWLDEPGFPLDPEIRAAIVAFGRQLQGQGAKVEAVRPVDGLALMEAYRILLMSAVAADKPASARRTAQALRSVAKLARGAGGALAETAEQMLAMSASHAEWIEADEQRARIGVQLKGVFDRFDVILAPIAPVAAFPHDHSDFARRSLNLTDGRKIAYSALLNWIGLASACGLPATAIPIGLTPDGLPVGAQLIGPRGGDSRTLSAAQAIELELGGFAAPPPLKP